MLFRVDVNDKKSLSEYLVLSRFNELNINPEFRAENLMLMITFQLVDMLRKYSLYILLINFIYQYYVFFHWYLDQQIQIENAFSMGLIAF